MKWISWFAWYPIRLQFEDKLVWLRWVEYEQISVGQPISGGPILITHYRLPDSAPEFRMEK